MNNALQYICDSEGQTVSVVVPIALWQEIMAERETTYLLSSPAMKARLLTARKRQDGISLEAPVKKLEFDAEALDDKIRILACRFHY